MIIGRASELNLRVDQIKSQILKVNLHRVHGYASKIVKISLSRSKYKYRSSATVPSDHVTSPQSLLHEESVVDRFIKVADYLVGNVDIT